MSSTPIDERIEAIYARHAASPRKRRAWSDNPGNRAAHAELARALAQIAAAQFSGSGPILDLGCGTGAWIQELASVVAHDRLYGLDAMASSLESAKRTTPGAHFFHADARCLPFADQTFAVVLLFTVLTDMASSRDVRRVVAESCRVLAPDGVLAIYEPRMPNPFNRSTRAIHSRDIAIPATSRSLTLFPPLARRLGRFTPSLYPALASVPILRTHRLWSCRT